LIEQYHTPHAEILHSDLYRINDVRELEAMGFRDYFDQNTIVLIEWPSRAANWLPKPDVICTLKIPENGQGRILEIMGV
jgi:tRNA threonylcarbamoyladenosine biosynthesis protein TsaE